MVNIELKLVNKAVGIEVGEAAPKKVIVRNGNEVTAPAVNLSKVDAFVDKLVPAGRFDLPRVLSQSVAVGTTVAKGTAVDLVLVPPAKVDLGLFDHVHIDLQTRTIADVAPLLDDLAVAQILNKYEDPGAVSPADKELLTGKLANAQITINDQAGRSFGDAFISLKGAQAFL